MKAYELLEHTADAKFRAYGKTLDEAFANAVLAMTAIATDPAKVEKKREREITIEGSDLKNLLFNLLDEIIFGIDTEGFLPALAKNLHVKKNETYTLKATLVGDDVKKYGANLKAPTYSDMIVEKKGDVWIIQAVVDI